MERLKTKKDQRKKNIKYNKNNKSELRKSLQFLEIIEDNLKWKYSIKFLDETKTHIYYNCTDSKCEATGIFILMKILKMIKIIIQREKYLLTKEHNLSYNEHNHNKIDLIKKDIEELPLNRIKRNYKTIIICKILLKLMHY